MTTLKGIRAALNRRRKQWIDVERSERDRGSYAAALDAYTRSEELAIVLRIIGKRAKRRVRQ